jgi:hypothetical protein
MVWPAWSSRKGALDGLDSRQRNAFALYVCPLIVVGPASL